jgi:hypothetical protein
VQRLTEGIDLGGVPDFNDSLNLALTRPQAVRKLGGNSIITSPWETFRCFPPSAKVAHCLASHRLNPLCFTSPP